LSDLDLDELVMYPVIVKMLSDQSNIRMVLYNFINYGAYIYGFPFFGWSAVLLLPVKIIFGQGYIDHLQFNMLLLRQFVNVLPSVLACFLFTYLATHFKKFWASLILFILLLTLPGLTGLNNTFWHPDGINLFFIALVLFYLDRDHLRFGSNFYFAAMAIGLSVATRLFGLFFFLAIAGLLIAGMIMKRIPIHKTFLMGILFILLMAGTIMVANPYLFSPGEPKASLNSFKSQSNSITQGWNEPDPDNIYRTGLDAWWPFFTRDYGNGVTLAFLSISALVGALGKSRKAFYGALLAWLVVIGTYLIGFVLVKSPWYILPFLIPLYGAAMAIPENLDGVFEKLRLNPEIARIVKIGIFVLITTLGLIQLVQNLQTLIPVFLTI
ncbi:MAG: hypothetical protein Q7U31_08645, partial [Anaerolineaceae bacterium]|nr:hypothetical protein [Anaerolineaceae bacterium]